MSQMTFSDYKYSLRKRKTKREEFLDIMNEIIPWEEWVEFVRPYYSSGKIYRCGTNHERRCNNACNFSCYVHSSLLYLRKQERFRQRDTDPSFSLY